MKKIQKILDKILGNHIQQHIKTLYTMIKWSLSYKCKGSLTSKNNVSHQYQWTKDEKLHDCLIDTEKALDRL